jgi:putative PEP-CTERM system histidine kinase
MHSFGTWSYGLAAAAYLALSILLMTRWRQSLQGSALLSASVVNCAWAITFAWQATDATMPLTAIFLVEITRDITWLIFLVRVLSGLGAHDVPRWLRLGVYGSALLVLMVGLGMGALHDIGFNVDSAGAVLIPGSLLLSLGGIVLVEQVYRNTRASQEWSLKFLWIGAAALFAYDFCLYSTALLLRGIPVTMWDARGAINALVVPLIGVGAARVSRWAPQTFMSRRPAFFTTSIMAAGVYLLTMAFAGYYIRTIGGTWGGAAQIVFLFGAGLLLVIVLFSGQARARVRVFLAKHFSPYKYDYRAEWLRLTRTLAAPADASLADRTLLALAQVVHSDAGGVWIRNDEHVFVPVGGDLAGPHSAVVPADSDFLRSIAQQEWITNVDARRRGGSGDRPDLPIPDWLMNIERAWLVVPLSQDQQLVAFVIIARPLVPQELTWEDLDLLRAVGRQAAGYIALDRAARQLAQAQQFEAYNRFAAFMMHDLKNLIAQQSLVVQNAARHRDNPQFIDDAISTIENSVKRMSRLLEQLKRGETLGPTRRVNVAEICSDTVRRCADRAPAPVLGAVDPTLEVHVSPERLGMVLEHVIRNAQDATPAHGRIEVEVRRNAGRAIIAVADNGRGMDASFVRDRLFQPFHSTKGSAGMGIGAFQTREFARMSGGEVHVESEPGTGTRFEIALPLAAAA